MSDERSKTHHGSPRQPDMVLSIINWRDNHGWTWQAIGDKYEMTRAGARYFYCKWYDWAKEAS
jgi:hypothetical protein